MKVRRIIGVCLGICLLAILALRAFWHTRYKDPMENCLHLSSYTRTSNSLVVHMVLTNQYRRMILYQDGIGFSGLGVKVTVNTKTSVTNFESGDLDNAGWYRLRAGERRMFSLALPEDTVSWRVSTSLLAPSPRMSFMFACDDAGLRKWINYRAIEFVSNWIPKRMDPKWVVESDQLKIP